MSLTKGYRYHKILDDFLLQFGTQDLDIGGIDSYWKNVDNGLKYLPFLEKLIDDGYLKRYPNMSYYLTFQGRLLLETGGYIQKEKSKVSLSERVEKNETWIRRATIWAAIFGGILVVWEIIKFILDRSPENINYFN